MGPGIALHWQSNPRWHDMGRMLVTIHDPRCINRIDPSSHCDDLLIRFKIAGVAVEILIRGKLCWIDINADNDPLGDFFGGSHKCQMPVMDGPIVGTRQIVSPAARQSLMARHISSGAVKTIIGDHLLIFWPE